MLLKQLFIKILSTSPAVSGIILPMASLFNMILGEGTGAGIKFARLVQPARKTGLEKLYPL